MEKAAFEAAKSIKVILIFENFELCFQGDISLISNLEKKKDKKELEEDELVSLNAIRYCKTETKGEVLGKFEISKEDLAKDEKIKRFIEIGFIVEL